MRIALSAESTIDLTQELLKEWSENYKELYSIIGDSDKATFSIKGAKILNWNFEDQKGKISFCKDNMIFTIEIRSIIKKNINSTLSGDKESIDFSDLFDSLQLIIDNNAEIVFREASISYNSKKATINSGKQV